MHAGWSIAGETNEIAIQAHGYFKRLSRRVDGLTNSNYEWHNNWSFRLKHLPQAVSRLFTSNDWNENKKNKKLNTEHRTPNEPIIIFVSDLTRVQTMLIMHNMWQTYEYKFTQRCIYILFKSQRVSHLNGMRVKMTGDSYQFFITFRACHKWCYIRIASHMPTLIIRT